MATFVSAEQSVLKIPVRPTGKALSTFMLQLVSETATTHHPIDVWQLNLYITEQLSETEINKTDSAIPRAHCRKVLL